MHPATTFLQVLQDPPTTETFQLCAPQGTFVVAHILHGRFATLAPTFTLLNREGANIYVTINATDGKGRRTENVIDLRALFVDVDRPECPAFRDPSMIVASGHGWHAYWALTPGEPLTLFSAAQRALATYYQSDPCIHDLPRVMRLPGYMNHKDPPQPVTVTVPADQPKRTIQDILALHDLPMVVAPPPPPPLLITLHDTAITRYRAWASMKEMTEGVRNVNAFKIAAEGFRRGIPPETIWALVENYCQRAGIPAEAKSVFRSASTRI